MYIFDPLLFTISSLLLPTLCCFGLSLVFAIAMRMISSEQRLYRVLTFYFFHTLPIALIAFCAGVLTGLSRSPAVGSVLPAVLALFAGLTVYVFGSDNRFKVVVGYSASVFIFLLFLGIQVGGFQRETQRESYLKYLSEQEFRIRAFRKNLGLPDEVPSWITGSDSK
jgi:hypothetical protein